MKKIPTLFKRDFTKGGKIYNEYSEGTEWVRNGDGVATKKVDGTCCLVRNGKLYKRYEVKNGGTPPYGFEPANEIDPETGKQQGWVEVGNGNEDKWHREAVGGNPDKVAFLDATYELLGPKIQGNPEGYPRHILVAHDERFGVATLEDVPTDFESLKEWLRDKDIEGIVWHHPDGRMVKIKKKDFGLKRKP